MDAILFLFLFHHLIVSRTFYSLNSSSIWSTFQFIRKGYTNHFHLLTYFSSSLNRFLFFFFKPFISFFNSVDLLYLSISLSSLVLLSYTFLHIKCSSLEFITFPDCFWNSSAHNSCDHLKTNFESKMCCRTHENRIDGQIIHLSHQLFVTIVAHCYTDSLIKVLNVKVFAAYICFFFLAKWLLTHFIDIS